MLARAPYTRALVSDTCALNLVFPQHLNHQWDGLATTTTAGRRLGS